MNKKPLIIDFKIALEKAAKYCAYQERCHWDLEKKFRDWNIDPEIQDEILAELIIQNYLNEERFSIAYAQGKVNIKKWGRIKITHELKNKRIPAYSINKAIGMIDEEKYILNLQKLLEVKRNTIAGGSEYERKMKLIKFLLSKGYEMEIINDNID